MSDADIAAELITGRGSAEMFLLFQLRRLDVWPTGDLSVRSGYVSAWSIATPTPKALDALGEQFRPYRSVIALYTWKVAANPAAFADDAVPDTA
ncbi:hypothetical protein [Streptomyces sp. NPDC056227]|uniref:hypothetical protein n=1 Tax=Streptomyces sp. NPDC056227 TaxID=3345753 RepID=UPI0035D6C41F